MQVLQRLGPIPVVVPRPETRAEPPVVGIAAAGLVDYAVLRRLQRAEYPLTHAVYGVAAAHSLRAVEVDLLHVALVEHRVDLRDRLVHERRVGLGVESRIAVAQIVDLRAGRICAADCHRILAALALEDAALDALEPAPGGIGLPVLHELPSDAERVAVALDRAHAAREHDGLLIPERLVDDHLRVARGERLCERVGVSRDEVRVADRRQALAAPFNARRERVRTDPEARVAHLLRGGLQRGVAAGETVGVDLVAAVELPPDVEVHQVESAALGERDPVVDGRLVHARREEVAAAARLRALRPGAARNRPRRAGRLRHLLHHAEYLAAGRGREAGAVSVEAELLHGAGAEYPLAVQDAVGLLVAAPRLRLVVGAVHLGLRLVAAHEHRALVVRDGVREPSEVLGACGPQPDEPNRRGILEPAVGRLECPPARKGRDLERHRGSVCERERQLLGVARARRRLTKDSVIADDGDECGLLADELAACRLLDHRRDLCVVADLPADELVFELNRAERCTGNRRERRGNNALQSAVEQRPRPSNPIHAASCSCHQIMIVTPAARCRRNSVGSSARAVMRISSSSPANACDW